MWAQRPARGSWDPLGAPPWVVSEPGVTWCSPPGLGSGERFSRGVSSFSSFSASPRATTGALPHCQAPCGRGRAIAGLQGWSAPVGFLSRLCCAVPAWRPLDGLGRRAALASRGSGQRLAPGDCASHTPTCFLQLRHQPAQPAPSRPGVQGDSSAFLRGPVLSRQPGAWPLRPVIRAAMQKTG